MLNGAGERHPHEGPLLLFRDRFVFFGFIALFKNILFGLFRPLPSGIAETGVFFLLPNVTSPPEIRSLPIPRLLKWIGLLINLHLIGCIFSVEEEMSLHMNTIEEIERHDRERFERLGLTKDEASIFTMIHIDPRGNLMLRWTIGHNKTPEDFVRTINSGLRKIVEAGEDEIFTDCIAELHEDAVYMKRIGGGRPAVFPLDEDEWEEGDYEYCPEDELFHRRKDRSGL